MMPPVTALKPIATSRSASSTRPRSKCPHALGERAGQLSLNHRQLRVLELLIREPEETITAGRWAGSTAPPGKRRRLTRTAWCGPCSWRNRPGRTSTPHASSHAAGEGEGHRNTGPPDIWQNRDIAGHNGKITGRKSPNHWTGPPPQEPPEAPSGPKIGRPEKGAGTVRDRRPDRGGIGPENTRFGAENREFSDPQKFDKKLHRSTG